VTNATSISVSSAARGSTVLERWRNVSPAPALKKLANTLATGNTTNAMLATAITTATVERHPARHEGRRRVAEDGAAIAEGLNMMSLQLMARCTTRRAQRTHRLQSS
jgi:hypothetical protein